MFFVITWSVVFRRLFPTFFSSHSSIISRVFLSSNVFFLRSSNSPPHPPISQCPVSPLPNIALHAPSSVDSLRSSPAIVLSIASRIYKKKHVLFSHLTSIEKKMKTLLSNLTPNVICFVIEVIVWTQWLNVYGATTKIANATHRFLFSLCTIVSAIKSYTITSKPYHNKVIFVIIYVTLCNLKAGVPFACSVAWIVNTKYTRRIHQVNWMNMNQKRQKNCRYSQKM